MAGDGPVFTDNGNMIADAHTGPTIIDPISTEIDILQIAGVVQVGLFNNMCDAVVLAGKDGIETFINPNGRLDASCFGGPDGVRTRGRWIKSPSLYLTKLQAHAVVKHFVFNLIRFIAESNILCI